MEAEVALEVGVYDAVSVWLVACAVMERYVDTTHRPTFRLLSMWL